MPEISSYLNLITYARTHTRYSTDNPSSHPLNPDVLLPLHLDNLLSALVKACVAYPSAPTFGYRKAVPGYPGLLRSKCRWNVRYTR